MKKVIAAISVLGLVGCASTGGGKTFQLTSQFDANEVSWSEGKGTATISGQSFVQTRGGQPRTCAGRPVNLVPVSAYAEERIRILYGNTYQGYNSAFTGVKAKFVPDVFEFRSTIRNATCDAQGNFEFSGIPAGDYFVISSITWVVDNPFIPQGGTMMKKVSIAEGESTRAILTP
ncbi:hypothetical protein [Microbulbifer aggregans]|uniref:hypothetical protein n=1 Tax=Microbulbifer aggregans TaxID=1769779 RepID=UPI001CFD8195|nr:hypothetical protein [Microbulbifer aggregans]